MEDASQVIETTMSKSAGEIEFPVLFDDESILSDGERNAKAPKPEYYPFPVLAERFPQIAKRVEMMWGHPELDAYLNKLIIDERGNRAGFPAEIITALLALSKQHLEHFNFNPPKDTWPEEIGFYKG